MRSVSSLSSVALNSGESAVVVVRLSVPPAATIGTLETGTITATGQTSPATDRATDVTLVVAGDLDLTKSVNPPGDQLPGAELTYVTDYRNIGTDSLTAVVIVDPIPVFTEFKVGSMSTGTPPASITAITPEFSNDGGATWAYSPVSGGGGAPAGFDANVTNVRFVLSGELEPGGASAIGVSFAVRIVAE